MAKATQAARTTTAANRHQTQPMPWPLTTGALRGARNRTRRASAGRRGRRGRLLQPAGGQSALGPVPLGHVAERLDGRLLRAREGALLELLDDGVLVGREVAPAEQA